jgi:alanine dehydrogenase
MKGLNVYKGNVTCAAVAKDQGLEYVDPTTLF